MPTIDSPLRYPGGKTQIAPFVGDLLRVNDLDRGVYAEPFAGGAGVAWRLLFTGQVGEVWLNDIDSGIYSFWESVLNNTDRLCKLIEDTPVSMEEWYQQRTVLRRKNSSVLSRGFATLFLNRTNRSGIIDAGVIGGKSQNGTYKLNCRFNKNELIEKIRRIKIYRDAVQLTQLDAKLCIEQWVQKLPRRAFLNIDPPYYAKGQALYTNFYEPRDHIVLADAIKKLQCPWMLTYDDEPEIEALYSGFPIYRKSLMYYAQVKRRANELLVLSPQLLPPKELREIL
ncbi:MAG: DNA adenine methylase [Desulfovibrionaceae bacterium]|nr:DNA adenine methylase [Desulfovibrionaceae bacterium]